MTHSRTCPHCESDSLVSPQEARAVFTVSAWGADALLDDARRVCSYCKAVDRGDTWDRLVSVDERAYELAQAGNKSKDEYREQLTSGKSSERQIEDTGKNW